MGDTTVTYEYDAFSRLTQKVTKQGETVVKTEVYTFADWIEETDEGEKTYTSMQVAEYRVVTGGTDITYTYTYDKNGNILTIGEKENNITKTISYVYDSANQLVRENNQAEGYTRTWEYDDAGNILSRTEYTYTTVESLDNVTPDKTVAYAYNDDTWGDLLTTYDNQGITYDNIGNPVNDGTWTYEWQRGRQLKSMSEIGGDTVWTYTYDSNGMRTGRTDGTTTYSYVYNGSQLVQMTVGINTLRFTYDAAGTPLSVNYNGTTYYYVTNIQGDVVAIVNASGVEQVRYTYGAWGQLLSTTGMLATTLGANNPLRYRGYVYDTETSLYYVFSRYYNPETSRWINADDTAYLGADGTPLSYNLFTYCKDNSVMGYDPTGHWNLFGAIVGGIVGAVVGGIAAAVTGGDIGDVLIGATAGAFAGAVIGVTGDMNAGRTVGRAVGSVINAAGSYITARKNGASIEGAFAAAGTSFAITYATASISGVSGLDLFTSTMVDATIGLGGALCNSAITSAITNATSEPRTKSGGQVQTSFINNTAMSKTFAMLR